MPLDAGVVEPSDRHDPTRPHPPIDPPSVRRILPRTVRHDELSDGTRRVYSLAAPWLDIIDRGRTIVVDELERSLHPHLVRFLTGLINRPGRLRDQRAQLVVTMHDTVLLREGLDRNQIWLTEKGAGSGCAADIVVQLPASQGRVSSERVPGRPLRSGSEHCGTRVAEDPTDRDDPTHTLMGAHGFSSCARARRPRPTITDMVRRGIWFDRTRYFLCPREASRMGT